MEKVNPAQMNGITSSLSIEEQKQLHSIVQKANEIHAGLEQIPEHSLNGN
jgi:hypothetical protein